MISMVLLSIGVESLENFGRQICKVLLPYSFNLVPQWVKDTVGNFP